MFAATKVEQATTEVIRVSVWNTVHMAQERKKNACVRDEDIYTAEEMLFESTDEST